MATVKNIRLLKILNSFCRNEFRDFGKFLNSPLYNTNRTIIKFYDFLKPYYPAFEDLDIHSEKVFKKIFEGRVFNGGVMRNLVSDMLRLSEEFMVYLRFNNNTTLKSLFLLKEHDARRLDTLFEISARKFKETLDASKVKEEDYYLNRHFFESIRREFGESRVLPGKSTPVFSQISEEIDSLINFFIIKILKEYFKILNVQKQLNFSFREEIFEFILNYAGANQDKLEKVFIIRLLYKFLVLSKEKENDPLYEEIKMLLALNPDEVGHEYLRVFYTELYNYCKRRQAVGEKKFGRESFELINHILTLNPLPGEGPLFSAHSYINIISTAIREGEIAWAENFAGSYKKAVIPEQRENAYFYSLALINFSRGKNCLFDERKRHYEKALEYLVKVKAEDFYYQARTKNISLRIYYELNELDAVIAMIDSYKHFLSGNKNMPGHLNKRYTGFVYFLNKLVRIKTGAKRASLWNLKKELGKDKEIEYREWLMEKAGELDEN
jgi:hypothetical protein